MNLGERLGYRIKALREARGWQQERLAIEADKSVSLITKLERGRSEEPTYRAIRDIAMALGVDLTDIDEELADYYRAVRTSPEGGASR